MEKDSDSKVIYEHFNKTAKISRAVALIVSLILSFLLPTEIRIVMFYISGFLFFALLFQFFIFPFLFKINEKMSAYISSLLYLTPVYLIIGFTGGIYSPLFFLMFFPPIGVAMSVGSSGAFVTVFYQLFFCLIYLFWNPSIPEPCLTLSLLKMAGVSFLIGPFASVTAKRYLDVKRQGERIQSLVRQLQSANIQIRSVEKMKSDLLNMASHEFRTPLSAIKSAIWFLNKDEVKNQLDEKAQINVDRIEASTERLLQLQENLSAMLKTASGELKLELESVQLEQVIQQAIEAKKVEALEKQVSIFFHEPEQILPLITADPVKLKYVFWELLTNSLKYTPAGGEILVQTEVKEESLKISIADTGSGISEEKQESLFQSFDKIDFFHTTQSGFGLGLYIVRAIIDLHQGEIEIESAEGQGTIVIVSLPR